MALSPPTPSGDVDEDEDDMHYCLRCRRTIRGLDEYVRHRKNGCSSSSSSKRPSPPPPTQQQQQQQEGLKADDFFSLLELQSSSKTAAASGRDTAAPTPPDPAVTGTPGPPVAPSTTATSSSGMLTRSKSSPSKTRNTLKGPRTPPRHRTPPRRTSPRGELRRRGGGGRGRCVSRKRGTKRKSGLRRQEKEDDDDDEEDGDDGGAWRPSQEPDGPEAGAGGRKYIWRGWRTPSPTSATPPPSAGGKWGPPASYTGGKWKPKCEHRDEEVVGHRDQSRDVGGRRSGRRVEDDDEEVVGHRDQSRDVGGRRSGRRVEDDDEDEGDGESCQDAGVPPPNHTRGKWAPGMANKVRAVLLGQRGADAGTLEPASVRKSGSTVQYWCGSCNRRLANSKMYERHLQSDLHFRRVLPERQLEMGPVLGKERPLNARPLKGADSGATPASAVGKASKPERIPDDGSQQGHGLGHGLGRGSLERLDRCPVCRARVLRHQVGKHLVSHFHWRSTRTTAVGSVAADLILDNIEAVVRQCPFQCGPCRFFCNTSEAFRQHWASDSHRRTDRRVAVEAGQYWCSPCEVGRTTTEAMTAHLSSAGHREVEAAVNRSVAVVVSRRTALRCTAPGCDASFRYNAQLSRHERVCGHRHVPLDSTGSTASDRYQSRFRCAACGVLRRSRLALQKHKLKAHNQTPSCFFYCGVCAIDFPTAASAAEHRLRPEHRDAARDRRLRRAQRHPRRCPHCRLQCRGLAELRLHLQDKHPDRKHRCALCGLAFTLPQEVSRHHRQVHANAPAAAADATPAGAELSLIPGDGMAPPYVCSPCSFTTDSKAEFIFHRVLHGPPEIAYGAEDGAGDAPDRAAVRYRCPLCSKQCRKVALRTHLHVHTGERPFRCRHCHKVFSRKDSCVTHELSSHADAGAHGQDENVVVEQRDELDRRLQAAISSIVDLTPSKANRSATNDGISAGLAANLRRTTPTGDSRVRNHLCDVCGKCFFSKSTLRQHQVSLHGVKPLGCSWPGCVIRCRSVAELRSHVNTHATEPEAGADVECKTCHFRARTKALLKRHEKIHSGEKAYKCEHCDFATRVSSHLIRHRRLHTGAKPYSCPHCNYRCNSLENLRKHVLRTTKHPGKSLYACRFCVATQDHDVFVTNMATEFKSHLARAHSDRFRSVAAAATFVAGIYDKALDPGPDQVARVVQVKPRGRSRTLADLQEQAESVLAIQEPSSASSVHLASTHEDPVEEDLPTSLLPKHALLDGELFPVVVTESDSPQDVVYVQLEVEENVVVVGK